MSRSILLRGEACDGDIDNIRPLDEDVDYLIAEANYLLPGMPQLTRHKVLFAWAGVRPLTFDEALPKGNRSREIHDLSREGMPNVFALTAGPIMTHRSAGLQLTEIVKARLAPSREERELSFAPSFFPENQNSPPLLDDYTQIKIADLRHAAEREDVANLVDLLFRRVGVGWTRTMGAAAARRAADAVAPSLGWDARRVDEETRSYLQYVADHHWYHLQ